MILISIVYLFLVIFLCSSATHDFRNDDFVENSNKTVLLRRKLTHSGKKEHFYTDTALNFLKNYGLHYHLFDIFFNPNDTMIQVPVVKPKHSFGISDVVKPEQSSSEKDDPNAPKTDISEHYLTKDYDSYGNWSTASATVKSEYASLVYKYNPFVADQWILDYNNRFRYGPEINERFFTVGFNYDIWQWHNKDSGFYHNLFDGEKNPYYVYFIGFDTAFSSATDGKNYYCNFTYPVSYDNPNLDMKHLLTPVEIIDGIKNVIGQPTLSNVIKCQVPIPVLTSMKSSSSSDTAAFKEEVHLDFMKILSNPSEQDGTKAYDILLKDVTIPRLHEVDRRKFTYTIETILENLEDVIIVEWLIYNILLGVEHFYLFHNIKTTNYSLKNSVLRPFLDANIITLFYCPFLHSKDYGNIQQAAFNIHLNHYGYLNSWTLYIDVDEFFLPTKEFIPTHYSQPVLSKLIAGLAPNGNEPGIMFDSQEMDCSVDSENFYHGGNNLNDKWMEEVQHELHKDGDNKQQGPSIKRRFAVTTHCLRAGFQFEEWRHGHGKMLLKPSKLLYLNSPHRLNERGVVRSDGDGGLIRHFDRFRYTEEMIKNHQFKVEQIVEDSSLKDFALLSLKSLLGITTSKTN
jgi:hypothetical protein